MHTDWTMGTGKNIRTATPTFDMCTGLKICHAGCYGGIWVCQEWLGQDHCGGDQYYLPKTMMSVINRSVSAADHHVGDQFA